MELIFRNAVPEEAQEILALYQSVMGGEFCVWNEAYPGMQEISQDLETGNLFVLTQSSAILGTISIVPENEMDDFSCWRRKDGAQREIARVAVAREYQGRGLSLEMVRRITPILQKRGCRAIHLSVVKHHLPARKTYQKAGFVLVGEARMYGNLYDLMELEIETDNK